MGVTTSSTRSLAIQLLVAAAAVTLATSVNLGTPARIGSSIAPEPGPAPTAPVPATAARDDLLIVAAAAPAAIAQVPAGSRSDRLVLTSARNDASTGDTPAWTGGVQLYRDGAFSKQATIHWCVAASTQTMRNLVAGEDDHAEASQAQYFAYGRAHNRYPIPASDGIDPAGWQALLRRYVDPGYRIVAAQTYVAAVRAAAAAIRLTGRPVGLLVDGGLHVWVMSGFTSTTDPAVDPTFTVTSVNVEAPLFGWTTHHLHDPAPNSQLSAAAFSAFLTPYHDRYEPHGWPGRYVILVPTVS